MKSIFDGADIFDSDAIDKIVSEDLSSSPIEEEVEEEYEEPEEFTQDDYDKWYAEQRRIADIELVDFEKSRSRTFDDIVKKYSILVGLKGKSYIPATKIIFYSVIANQLKLNSFTMDTKKIDLRIPLLLQLKAGHGKKNYEHFIRRTIEGLKKIYQEPTSYHPEQFVGKIIVHESKHVDDTTYLPMMGTLAADFLVIDEAHALLTRKENEECLRYMRTALDPIGDNFIEKKQVNVPDEEKLRYAPNCTILLLTQPITNINEDLLMRGSFRRFVILFIQTSLEERMQARRDANFLVLKEDIHNKIWERWIDFNKRLLEYTNLKYVCSDFTQIDSYLDDLGKHASSMGPEVLEFYNTSQFTIKQNIFKMAIIRAVVEHIGGDTINITMNHISMAIRDWQAIWIPQVQWIAQQMAISSLDPIKWSDKTHGLIINLLLAIPDKKCKTAQLLDMFCKEFNNIPLGTAKQKAYRALNDLKKWGYIDRISDGQKGYVITVIKECTK